MSFFKRRALPGRLALACLLAGSLAVSLIPATGGQAIAATGPDLTIESIVWSPENPSLRDTMTFTTTIKNQGDSPADASHIAYYIDNSLIQTAYVNPIEAGNSITSLFTWQATAGEHNIKAVVDSDNVIIESNEDNDVKIYAFSVLAADLIVTSITWSPEITSAGNPVTFTLTVKNQGNKTAPFCWVELFIDGATRGRHEGARLEPGENFTRNYPWTALAGPHTLKASVDVLNQTIESDETNNDLTVIYTTTPPDLVIDAITWSPVDRTDTDNVTMSITVKNQGAGTAYGSYLAYYIDGQLQTTTYVNSLEANATDEETYSWLVGPEEHTFTATIDADKQVYESDETNNTKSVILPATGLPDLLIQSITWTPATPMINSRITFTVIIKNAGKRAVSNCDFYLYVAQDRLTGYTGPIPAGGTVSLSLPWITSTTSTRVLGIVDPNNFLAESDESNNEKTTSLTSTVPTLVADLVITSLTCTPESPRAGDTVKITAIIKNNGNGAAGESDVAYYIDGKLIGEVPLNRLASGATGMNSLIWTATSGAHTIRASADYRNSITETNESNNSATTTITIIFPDLTISSITWTPEVPSKGETVNITVTIINQGNLESSSCYVSYYVDGSYQGNLYVEKLAPGGTVTRNFTCIFLNDTLSFKAIIDKEDSVLESDESNNDKTVTIPAPDLPAETITPPPADSSDNSTTVSIPPGGDNSTTASIPPGGNDGAASTTGSGDVGAATTDVFQNPGATTESSAIPPAPGEAAITDNSVTGTPEDSVNNALVNTEAVQEQDVANPTNVPADEVKNNDETTTDTTPAWQNLLMNRWLIIGVAGLGVAGIFVLLLLRKRAKAAKTA